jgi:anaerobic dimethyl sulfoxide reductase subunit B (iron-sulfur subunit)
MYKEDKYGAVLIDPDKATSFDLRRANQACPYGAISFDSDAINANASKCTMCIDRLEQGLMPVCVMSCRERALDFGHLADLQTKYGTLSQLEDIPSPETTNPAVVFKPKAARKQLVPYNADRALQLLASRDPLPPVYSSPSDVTDIPAGLIKRNAPVFHPINVAEAIRGNKNDEG